jgi:ferritin-like protein
MAGASESLHEAPEDLTPELVDRHRAIVSMIEELEAIDWYDQRVAATSDPDLAAILAHNRDEEKEHAAMILEWLRRHDPVLDAQLRTYLFKAGPLLDVHAEDEATFSAGPSDGSLGIATSSR